MSRRFTEAQRQDAFWAKVVEADSGCWLWLGAKGQKGYGRCRVGSAHVAAHRRAYELVIGVIPSGLEIDHLCRVRACVNPAHLEPVTHVENVRRGERPVPKLRFATYCKRGHLLAGTNLYVSPRGGRHCRACRREQMRAYLPDWRAGHAGLALHPRLEPR